MQSRKLLRLLPLLLIILASCSRDPKVQAQRYLDNGNKFFAKAKYKEAAIMYRKALQKDLRFGEAYYRLGLTDLKLGSYSDAIHQLERAVSLQPDNVDATVKLADIFLVAAAQDANHRAQIAGEVDDLSAKLLKRDPKSFDGHRIRGQLAVVTGKPADAVLEFEKANAIRPLDQQLVISYFEALAATNRMPEADKLARDMIAKQKNFSPMYDLLYIQYMRQNKPADAEQLLKLKIENNPDRAQYVLQLAQHYYLLQRRPDLDATIQRLTDEKKFPEGHLLAGDFFMFRAHDYDRAADQYQAAMKAFPKEKAIYEKRLVELYASTGKNQDANSLLASILKENPKDVDAIAMRAALMLTTGNREQINIAANDLQSLVSKSPQNHLYRFNYARALIAKTPPDVDAARLQLEESIRIRPDFLAARQLLAKIYLSKGDAGHALKISDDMLAYDRNNLQGHLIRSSALLVMGDKDKAHQEINYITKAYPQNSEARYQEAFLAWEDKDFKRAEQLFSELNTSNPDDHRGLGGLTEALVSEGRMTDAIAVVQKGIQKEPQRGDLKLFLAHLDMRAEHYDDAIGIYKALLDKEPKSPSLLFQLGETERRKGDLNASIDSFRRCTQESPNSTACLLQLGLLMDGTGKREQAKPIYEQILKIEPDHPVALNNLAFIKAEEGTDLDQALTMAQRARQKAPASPDIADTLGWIYIKKNMSEDAVRVFTDLVQKDPGNPTFHYHYGMALLQKGDKSSAKKELETALKDNPSIAEKGKIQDLLQHI
jgi:tetratricopeptide (TPR) repeat protein